MLAGCGAHVGEVATVVVMYVDLVNGKLDVLADKHYVESRRSCNAQSLSTKVIINIGLKMFR